MCESSAVNIWFLFLFITPWSFFSESKKAKGPLGFGGFLLLIISVPVKILGLFVFIEVVTLLIWDALGVM